MGNEEREGIPVPNWSIRFHYEEKKREKRRRRVEGRRKEEN